MLTGTVVLAGLALGLCAVLVLTDRLLPAGRDRVAEQVESLLPRIQCGQCGYPGCRPYAEAIAAGEADINRCPPGGEETVRRLADFLGRDVLALDTTLGSASMNRVARIDERNCIGCNRCVPVCPVDAVVGVQQTIHAVIAAHCTGCEICLAHCPVDCIDLVTRDA